ncbi:MAG: hypothetical protein P0Y50_08850 [Candidatus Brevundimonas colombiensis]|uniref:Uncharacterized protein n=1 Tax=Candidatus Brevundimonas colombiensis TaxID=3121376 RepID=A0AAJ6BIC0_9CAUL|nr:hypothetical protein [Brevundimonas sp.]WEK38660.1 MAG: hypothetical protein P0Y50_08850 [Brevundimonas sp.]
MTTRKRRKATPRVQTKRLPWDEPFSKLFRLCGANGWTQPKDVLIRVGSRTWSYVADFTADDGAVWRATVRIDPVRKAVLEEKIEVRYVMKAKAA